MKIWMGLMALFLLLLPRAGATAEPRARFYTELEISTLRRDIVEEEVSFLGQTFPGSSASVQSLRLLGKLGMRLSDRVHFYGLMGLSDLEVDDFGFRGDLSGTYGVGIHIQSNRNAVHSPFAEYRYLRVKPKDTVRFAPSVDADGDGLVDLGELLADEEVSETLEWVEHVLRLGVRGKYDPLEPYGGIQLSWVQGTDTIPARDQTIRAAFEQDASLGVFLGTAYSLSDKHGVTLFIEGSLLDQRALAGGVRAAF